MNREEAAEWLEMISTYYDSTRAGKALEVAIATLRESEEPAELTKEQYMRLSDIFHQQYDKWAETKGGPIPVASFAAVVGMVEAFNIRKQPAPEQMEFSNAFIEALEEVIRISDREHDAWNEVKAFLTKQRKNKSHD